jgi:hypothetical protein
VFGLVFIGTNSPNKMIVKRSWIPDVKVRAKAVSSKSPTLEVATTPSSGIRTQMSELKRTLNSIQANRGEPDDDGDVDSYAPDNAGDSFGWCQKKKQTKE